MNNPYLFLLRASWKYAGAKKKAVFLVYVLLLCANITLALNPLFYGWFVDNLQKDSQRVLEFAWIYGLGFLLLRLVEWCFHGPGRILERKMAFQISKNYLDELYDQILHLPVDWHQDQHSGSIINRQRKAFEALRNFFQNSFIHLHTFGKFFFSFAAMLYFSPFFGGIGILIGILTVYIIYRFDKHFVIAVKECNEKEHKVYSTLFDSLSNIISVITLRLEKRMQSSLDQKLWQVFPAWKKKVTLNEWKWFVAQMLIGIIYSIITIGYIYQNWVPGEVMMVGALVTLLGYVNQFTSVFNDVASQYTQIIQFHADIQAVDEIQEAYRCQYRPVSESRLPAEWKEIKVNHLNFNRNEHKSNGRKNGNLNEINIKLEKGHKIALIGESGCGKSTLMALLRGLYQPAPGMEIAIDGDDWLEYDAIPNAVTLFPQEPEIFENSILYNITLGLPFSEEEVLHVCEQARISEIIHSLPDGLHTNIQEKGVNLSGGQKQRLALARGILAARSSSIVLLDEPTSSVDPRTEILIYDSLFNTFNDKALVSSLHRLHLLPQFDYIYILKDGKIIEEGTFLKLLNEGKAFKEMWDHQKDQSFEKHNYPIHHPSSI